MAMSRMARSMCSSTRASRSSYRAGYRCSSWCTRTWWPIRCSTAPASASRSPAASATDRSRPGRRRFDIDIEVLEEPARGHVVANRHRQLLELLQRQPGPQRLERRVRGPDVRDDIIGESHHQPLQVVERGIVGAGADRGDQRVAHAEAARDALVLEYLVARTRQRAHAQNGNLAQHRIDLTLEQQMIAEVYKGPQQDLAAGHHAEQVQRRQLAQLLPCLWGQ